MKKILLRITMVAFVCFMMTGAIGAYNNSTEKVNLNFGGTSAESDATCYGMAAKYYAQTDSASKFSATMYCMAGWKGAYPYTVEYSTSAPIGGSRTATVTQSRTSRFYLKLFSGYFSTKANGYVQVTKY